MTLCIKQLTIQTLEQKRVETTLTSSQGEQWSMILKKTLF